MSASAHAITSTSGPSESTLIKPCFDIYTTLERPVHFQGIGLHSGENVHMTLWPMDPGRLEEGIVFQRSGINGEPIFIPAHWSRVCHTTLSTNLQGENGVHIGTVEHILSALFMLGISSALIQVDGPEIPIMDGSAAPFIEGIRQNSRIITHSLRRPFAKVTKLVRVESAKDPSVWASLEPCDVFHLSIQIDFPETNLIGIQKIDLDVYNEQLELNLAHARTFVLEKAIYELRKMGLAKGGSLANALVIGENGILNYEGFREPDECVRHKALDCLGDLSLAPGPILGHFRASKPGHTLTQQLLSAVFSDEANWCPIYKKLS